MAIWRTNIPKNKSWQIVRTMLDYILNPEKTNEMLVKGIGCLPNTEDALRSMIIHRKTDGRQIVHGILSFDSKEPITEHQVLSLGKQVVEEIYPDCQGVVAVHINTMHIHCHWLVNSVNVYGKKLSIHRKEFLNQRKSISQILISNDNKPLVGYTPDDFIERDYTEDDMNSKDWLELYPESERIVVMSGNTLPDITLETAEDLFDDCDDEPSLSECYLVNMAQRHGFAVARCLYDAVLHHKDENYEEDNMKSRPTIRIGGGVSITTDKSNYRQNADLCGEILRHIPEEILDTHDIEIYAPNEICGVSQKTVDEIARAIGNRNLEGGADYPKLSDDKK